jgi:hypothetical protein
MRSNPPHQKKIVAIALLVCCAIAFALYASFPSRPPIRQPAIAPPDVPSGAPVADAGAPVADAGVTRPL